MKIETDINHGGPVLVLTAETFDEYDKLTDIYSRLGLLDENETSEHLVPDTSYHIDEKNRQLIVFIQTYGNVTV